MLHAGLRLRLARGQRPIGVALSLTSRRALSHVRVATTLQGAPLSLESGRVGPLTDSVVLAQYGGTTILSSVVSAHALSEENFLPLSVEYRERAFAYGAIPDARSRREGGGSDREVLIGRCVDRSLRPLFAEGYFYDTQVTLTLLSHDRDCDPAMLAVLAASAALHASSVPWGGPCAAVRVGWGGGAPLLCPPATALAAQHADSRLDLLLACASDGRALMLELGARQLEEGAAGEALRAAAAACAPLHALQHEFRAAVLAAGEGASGGSGAARAKRRHTPPLAPGAPLLAAVEAAIGAEAREAFAAAASGSGGAHKGLRSSLQGRLIGRAVAAVARSSEGSALVAAEGALGQRRLSLAAQAVVKRAMRESIVGAAAGAAGAAGSGSGSALERLLNSSVSGASSEVGEAGSSSSSSISDASSAATATTAPTPSISLGGAELVFLDAPLGSRLDGRSSTQVRRLESAVDVIPGVHGTGLFSRGDTQVLAACTLGPLDMALVAPLGPAYLAPSEGGAGLPASPFVAAASAHAEAAAAVGAGAEGGSGSAAAAASLGTPFRPTLDASAGSPLSDAVPRRFFLHYDFPPYATNEQGKVGGAAANRRMVGHGALAEKALAAVIPPAATFPYAMRVHGETTASDGSSSMATVCAATLALLDAGVPLTAPVAGVSIGVIASVSGGGAVEVGVGVEAAAVAVEAAAAVADSEASAASADGAAAAPAADAAGAAEGSGAAGEAGAAPGAAPDAALPSAAPPPHHHHCSAPHGHSGAGGLHWGHGL